MIEEDLDRVIEIEKRIFPFPWSKKNFADSLHAGYDAWVFEQAGQICGYAVLMWSLDEIHLLNLSVDSRFQRQGMGRSIMGWLGSKAKEQGARIMLLEVRPSNIAGIGLYQQCGFIEIGRRKNYYPAIAGTREHAIVMQANLPLAIAHEKTQ